MDPIHTNYLDEWIQFMDHCLVSKHALPDHAPSWAGG